MPRLLHMADVHLGARHDDLGEAAAKQRERQFAAFTRAIDAALDRRVDAVLICGDLFDSNAQPPRSVERAVGELKRLAERGIRCVLIPGTHDCYDQASIYRAFDLRAMARLAADSDLVTVLTPEAGDVVFGDLDMSVHGRVFGAKTRPTSPLEGFDATSSGAKARFRVGMIHGSMRMEGKVEKDDVLFTSDEVAASALDYLALGHWHSFRQGTAGGVTWAYPGAPEPVAIDQDGAGQVLLVTITARDGRNAVEVEQIPVGQTKFQRLEVDVASLDSQDDLERRLIELADADLVLDARLVGVLPATLDLNLDEVTAKVRGSFFGLRLRDGSMAALPEGPLPPVGTIAGVFTRELQARIEAAQADGATASESELREALHWLQVLTTDPARVTLP